MMKFIASSLEAAKSKAQRAFGERAVIIAVRNLPSGDVEVSASDKPQPKAPKPRVEPTFGEMARQALEERPTRSAGGARLADPLEQRYAEDALAKLRGDLSRSGKKGPAPGVGLSDKTARSMSDLLAPHGIGPELLAALIDGARRSRIDEDLYRLETAFAETFSYAPLQIDPATPIMLVGPTGAGKTSSAAKLASAATEAGGEAFIMTADAGRAGAVEQLRTYSDSIGANFFIVETPFDVEQALQLNKPRGVVLLDTPGVSPFDAGDVAALKSFREAAGAEPVLVLPASGDPAEFQEWALAFREFGVRKAIITKFDATKRVGAALAAAFTAKMALAHFSESAFISEGLMPASPEFLARRLLVSRPGRIG
ncbi:MAG TPA: hypothetical protein VNH64_03840 [Parvularculaceae bacterium]|nr:hypothetical protein [Parvularculaceae bacterium]